MENIAAAAASAASGFDAGTVKGSSMAHYYLDDSARPRLFFGFTWAVAAVGW